MAKDFSELKDDINPQTECIYYGQSRKKKTPLVGRYRMLRLERKILMYLERKDR